MELLGAILAFWGVAFMVIFFGLVAVVLAVLPVLLVTWVINKFVK